jgi:hypothetical protein
MQQIMNGDQAEYELQNVGTSPKERSDWPLPSFDARDWAESFCKTMQKQGIEIDEGMMIGWFAASLMRGFDEATTRAATTFRSRLWHRIVDSCRKCLRIH